MFSHLYRGWWVAASNKSPTGGGQQQTTIINDSHQISVVSSVTTSAGYTDGRARARLWTERCWSKGQQGRSDSPDVSAGHGHRAVVGRFE